VRRDSVYRCALNLSPGPAWSCSMPEGPEMRDRVRHIQLRSTDGQSACGIVADGGIGGSRRASSWYPARTLIRPFGEQGVPRA
jgi:hypothetical protein